MSSILNSTKLIATIKRRAFIPNDQVTFSNDDFLEMATEEINIGLMEQIIEARGNYLVDYVDHEITEGVFEYEIPSRAHGDKLRSVVIIDANGDVVLDSLQQVDLDLPSDMRTANSFHLNNNKVVLNRNLIVPQTYLRMNFYMRPNKLVQVNRAATITAIADNGDDTSTLSFATIPSHFTSSVLYDFVSCKSPNKIVKFDIAPVAVNLTTKTITIDSTTASALEIGCYVTTAEETIVPNVPTEYHPVIAQKVAVACLEAMGDEQNKQSAERKLIQMERSVLKIVTNRVEGQPKKIRQTNSPLISTIRNRYRTR
jgi:hypothetical protein